MPDTACQWQSKVEERSYVSIEEGIYKLKQDVKNPFVDRRKKNSWSHADTIPEGMRFIVKHETHNSEREGIEYTYRVTEVAPFNDSRCSVGLDFRNLLVPFLEKEPESLAEKLALSDRYSCQAIAMDVLIYLTNYVINADIIEKAIENTSKMEYEELKAMRKKHGF